MAKMPVSKKSYKKSNKKTFKRYKTMTSKKSFADKSYTIKRQGYLQYISSIGTDISGTSGITIGLPSLAESGFSNCYDIPASMNFSLQKVDQFEDFTALFQKYKIVGIKLKCFLDANISVPGNLNVLPRITYRVNTNESGIVQLGTSIPLTEQYLLASQYVKVKRMDKGFSVYFKPRAQTYVATQAGTPINSGVGISNDEWLTTVSTDIVHHGFQFVISNWYAAGGAQMQFRIQPTYYLALKDSF